MASRKFSHPTFRTIFIACLWIILVDTQWMPCNCSRYFRGESEEGRILIGKKKEVHNPFAAPLPKSPPGTSLNSEDALLFPPSTKLKAEVNTIEKYIAFGLFAPIATEETLNLISLWWVEGAVGCLFRDFTSPDVKVDISHLDVCKFPDTVAVSTSPHYSFALMPILLRSHFPNRKWYIIGDVDTVFSPLTLAQWLQNYNPNEPWYIGGRGDNIESRSRIAWDTAFGGSGIVLSDGFLRTSGPGFSRCLEVAPRSKVQGTSILHLCMSRFGVPMTASGGFHLMDEKDPVFVRHMIENHPSAPFLAMKFRQIHFRLSKLSQLHFFESMSRDPIGFLSLTVFQADGPSGNTYLGALSSGLSVRFWSNTGPFMNSHSSLLWDRTRTEAISPPPEALRKKLKSDVGNEIRYAYSRVQHQLPDSANVILTLYMPEVIANKPVSDASPSDDSRSRQLRHIENNTSRMKISKPQKNFIENENDFDDVLKSSNHSTNRRLLDARYPWAAIMVVEEVGWQNGFRVGAPRAKCHIASHHINFIRNGDSGPSALVMRVRDCAYRDVQHSGSKKELLGGMTGSAFADLIASAGGPPNDFNGMKEKEIPAPALPFFPGTTSGPKISPSSFHEEGRRLEHCQYVAWKKKVVCSEGSDQKEITPSLEDTETKHAVDISPPPPPPPPLPPPLPPQLLARSKEIEVASQQTTGFPDSDLVASIMAPSWSDWLAEERNFIVNEVVFGVLTSKATAESRLKDLRYWWLPGSKGCLSSDVYLPKAMLDRQVPAGLDFCSVPASMANRPWMKQGQKGRGLHRGAMMHLILLAHFPTKKWYIVGDDDTMFSPLALAQFLQTFDSSMGWYIGGRSEDLKARRTIGWDMAFGGGGIILSYGFLSANGMGGADSLRRCFDIAPWSGGPGGDWILYQCLSRIGLPLTPAGGCHQMDEHNPLLLKDIIERHPVAPFLSIHHVSNVFKFQNAVLLKNDFFRSLYHDPINFLQNTVVEILGGIDGAPSWTLAISSGLSARLYSSKEEAAATALWEQTRTEVMVPSTEFAKKEHSGEFKYLLALSPSSLGGGPLALSGVRNTDISVSVYRPAGDGGGHPYRFIVVTEERFEHRWTSAPRKLCHSTTYEVQPGKSTRSSVLGVGDAVLLVGLRSCQADPKQRPRIITRDSFLALIARASSPDPPVLDSSCTYSELPSGFNYMGRGSSTAHET